MAIAVDWYVPNRVLLLKGIRNVTDQDLVESDNLLLYHLEHSIRRPVHIIIDGTLIETVPNLVVFKKWQWTRHPALGNVAIFGLKNNTLRFVISAIAQLFGLRFSFQATLLDAVTALTRMDTDLAQTGSLAPLLQMEKPKDEDATRTQQMEQPTEVRQPFIPDFLRNQIVKSTHGRCEYCQLPMSAAIDLQIAEIVSLLDGGVMVFENLHLACLRCRTNHEGINNGIDPQTGKVAPLYHPRFHHWTQHFGWSDDRLDVVGLTPVGRATVFALKLNNQLAVMARQEGLEEGWHPPDIFEPRVTAGTIVPAGSKLRLDISDIFTNSIQRIVMPLRQRLLLGRFDPLAHEKPDIDLVIYGGYRLRVSRLHAEIRTNGNNMVTITDLGSTFGTYLNGERLVARQSIPLQSGDQIRLGELDLVVYFEI